VEYQKLSEDRLGEASGLIRGRVEAARQRQRERFDGGKSPRPAQAGPARQNQVLTNADMRVGEIRQHCKLDAAGESLVRAAMGQMNLSARGYHRVLKLARTIADLAGSETIQVSHVAESLQYRPKNMMV
jgi:magnesium chelatase family protein